MTDQTSFAQLGLAEPFLRALAAAEYLHPTPIQVQAIPPVLAGKDLIGLAQTGTGKTAAFALPILQRLAADTVPVAPRAARALVLAPTRELAIQIADAFKAYGRNVPFRMAVVFGGVGHKPQIGAMARGVDVLVATPGRLLDLMQQGQIRLDKTRTLVLDEADRMLDMGFVRDVRRIVATTPKARQSLMFSATMSPDIAQLSGEILLNPVKISVSPAKVTVEAIEQRVYHVDAADKRGLLMTLLADPALARVVLFARTKRGANRVAEQLEKAGVSVEAIHGNKSQNARQRALDNFRAGKVRVLAATDIAARGIDVDGVTHVINYELPNEPESYVHRIGRTARAGASGVALSFCDAGERAYLRDIERLTKQPLTVATGFVLPPRPAGERPAQPARPENRGRGGGGGGRGFGRGRERRAA